MHFHWNWIVVIYLFLAGVSAGAFAVSALAYFIGKETHEGVVRIGAYIAPFPLLIGILHLIFDLERPHLFWKLFLSFRLDSVMSIGAWLLLLFSLVSFVHFYLWLPDRFDVLVLLERLSHRFAEMKIVKTITSLSFLNYRGRENLLQWRGQGGSHRNTAIRLCWNLYRGPSRSPCGQAFLEQPHSPIALSSLGHEDRNCFDSPGGCCLDRF